MLLKHFPLALNDLPCKPKISNLKNTIINKDIRRLNVSVHKIKFIKFFESIKNLSEIVTNNELFINFTQFPEMSKKKNQIPLITKL